MVHLLKQNETSATLMEAARNGNVSSVELLIAAGAQVNYQDEVRFNLLLACMSVSQDGRMALYMAGMKGHYGVARMLLKAN